MISAKEMFNITITESSLAKKCDTYLASLLEEGKKEALRGHRKISGNLTEILQIVDYRNSYAEIENMCKIKLEALGYRCEITTTRMIHIFW